MTGQVTQKERVLAALRRHHRGVTQIEFDLPDVIDGGKPIKRVAARVEELRGDGHRIIAAGRRQKCTIYRLIETAGAAPAPADASPPSTILPAPSQLSVEDAEGTQDELLPLTGWFCTHCRQVADQAVAPCPACGLGLLVRISIAPPLRSGAARSAA